MSLSGPLARTSHLVNGAQVRPESSENKLNVPGVPPGVSDGACGPTRAPKVRGDTSPGHRPGCADAAFICQGCRPDLSSSAKRYIDTQREHHQKRSFQQEYRKLFERHGVEER